MSDRPVPSTRYAIQGFIDGAVADSWQRWLVELDCLVESKAEHDTIAGHLAWRPDRAHKRWLNERRP